MKWLDIPDKTLEELAKKKPEELSSEDVFQMGVYILSKAGKSLILTGETRDSYDAVRINYFNPIAKDFQISTEIALNLGDLKRLNLGEAKEILENPDILEVEINMYNIEIPPHGFYMSIFYDNIDPKWQNIPKEKLDKLFNGKLPWEKVFEKGNWLTEFSKTYSGLYHHTYL